jgi:hypothetical protein
MKAVGISGVIWLVISASIRRRIHPVGKGVCMHIVCGIQKLFEQRNQNHILLVKRLGVLATRLECCLTSKSPEDASFLLHTDFTCPRDLAEWYMTQDAK